MPKLNLHLHTTFSDGASELEDMLFAAKYRNHSCLITSDHDYMMTPRKYDFQIALSKELAEKHNFPIINALEINLQHEEAVLIGTDACTEWLKCTAKKDWKWRYLHEIIAGTNHALCLVHPSLERSLHKYDRFEIFNIIYKKVNCYEICNAGSYWPPLIIEQMSHCMKQAFPVKGLDAHGTEFYMDCPCNDIEYPITTEEDVIAWMKGELRI